MIDTKLTQGGSQSVRYRLISPSGEPSYQLYENAQAAANAAATFWPGVGQRDHDNGAEGWDIEVVRP